MAEINCTLAGKRILAMARKMTISPYSSGPLNGYNTLHSNSGHSSKNNTLL